MLNFSHKVQAMPKKNKVFFPINHWLLFQYLKRFNFFKKEHSLLFACIV